MSDIRQGIQDFYRVSRERDFTRDFQFRVLNIQTGVNSEQFTDDDLVYLKSATLPGRELTSNATNYMGMQFNIPGSATYTNAEGWQVDFYCDMNSRIRRYFEKQTFDVFDDETSTGAYNTPSNTQVIDLVQLDTQMNPINRYQLIGAWPKSVGELQYTIAEGKGAPVSFQVTFAYQFWRPA